MKEKNLTIIFIIILTNVISFFIGGYHTLIPIIFLTGLIFASIVSVWTAIRVETKDLVIFIVIATILAGIDEYLHASVGTLTYFDNAIPSSLTVFGWSLFMILIVTITRQIMKIPLFRLNQQNKLIRLLPVPITLILLYAMTILQGYIHIFNWNLILLYAMLGLASLFYTYKHSAKWNFSLMIVSLVVGFLMEFTGALEGLWSFHFNEPVSLVIVFSWPLRVWTVNAFCLLFKVDYSKIISNHP